MTAAHHLLFLLQSLPFQKIQHSITAQDHQPTPDSCIISMVMGQLKVIEYFSLTVVIILLLGRNGQAEESLMPLPSLSYDLFLKGHPEKVMPRVHSSVQ